LPSGPSAPRVARAQIDQLAGSLQADKRADLSLLVSELVTHSLRRDGGDGGPSFIELFAQLDAEKLRVEVSGAVGARGKGDAARSPEPGPEDDWTKRLLTNLADRWGTTIGRTRVVWAEVDLA
jgi:hypothetical protein